MAHRGGSVEILENTLQAFEHANKHGVNIIECDTRMTHDGVILVAHDMDYERMFDHSTCYDGMYTVR